MAFMIPVVRNEWTVYGDGQRSRESKSCPRSRQTSECRSDCGSLATSPNAYGEARRHLLNRSLALEIRPVQATKQRLSVGSLPSSFHSGHLSPNLGNNSPRSSNSKLSLSSKLLRSRFRKGIPVSEPASPGKLAAFSPRSQDNSPPKSGSQNSLQKFHVRLVDRLRRSFRLSSEDQVATAAATAPTS